MGTLCFMVHSKWVSRTSDGSMGRFALARAVPSETQRRTAYRCTLCSRLQAPAPAPAPAHTTTLLHPHTPTTTAGPRIRTPKSRGWEVLGPTSIYASYTPQTE